MNTQYDKKFLDGALMTLGEQMRDAGYVYPFNDDEPVMVLPEYAARIRLLYELPSGPFSGEVLMDAAKVLLAYCLDIITDKTA